MASQVSSNLATSKGHQWLTLIGATFFLFEIVFIGFYSNNFWFSLNLAWCGIPAIAVVGVLAHFLLRLLQSQIGCAIAAPALMGKPPVVYTKWLSLDEDGFNFGTRHVRFQAVDEARLTYFGNLEIRSRVLCGQEQGKPDVVFKLPYACASQATQAKFIAKLKAARPDVLLNERLQKRLVSPVVKGQNFVQSIGALIMLLLLFDLGFSSFFYLEMLKHYYLSQVDALAEKTAQAKSELSEADALRDHPLPISYITTRFLSLGNCASGTSSARAEALWYLGRRDEALAEAKKAIDYQPESYRTYLRYARLLEEAGSPAEARIQIEKAIDKHKDSMLPRLYLMANASDVHRSQVSAVYKQTMQELKEDIFAGEPVWPPGGESFTSDILYSKDIEFVYSRLLGLSKRPAVPSH